MSKTIEAFSFRIRKMDKDAEHPFNPVITLRLAQWGTDDEGGLTISAHLMNEGEIDGEIQALKDDLDVVGKKAKAALRRAKEEARNWKPS